MSHYFDPAPPVASRPAAVGLRLPDLEVELLADRGVFSAGGIDPGTLELLRAGAPGGPAAAGGSRAGPRLDLGCGYGPIAVALARRHPDDEVWAVDVNSRALELVVANAAALGLSRLRATTPDRVPDAIRFVEIWSNPPIRVGKQALHDLLGRWLPRLAPDGVAWMVVHKHLGSDSLAAWLAGQGWAVARVSSKRGYRVLRVGRP